MKLPTKTCYKIIDMLAEGYTQAEIERACRTTRTTIAILRRRYQSEIAARKKVLDSERLKGSQEKLAEIAKDCLEISRLAARQVRRTMRKASALQAATIEGIMLDKHERITGRDSGATIEIKFSRRDDAVQFIRGTLPPPDSHSQGQSPDRS